MGKSLRKSSIRGLVSFCFAAEGVRPNEYLPVWFVILERLETYGALIVSLGPSIF